MKRFSNEDRLKFLTVRIKRTLLNNKVYEYYSFREKNMYDIGSIDFKTGKKRLIIDDYIQALKENNEADREVDERFSL